jgi:hypothetical protein
VRDADHGGLGDRRVLVEDLLDLTRVDVVAAADDQVLLAVDDEEVAVGVLAGQVAGAEPPVGDRLPGRLLAGPVALHQTVAPDRDLADLAGRDVAAVEPDQPQLDALDGGADRAGLAVAVGMVERGHRGGLRQAVALQDDAAEGGLEAAQHLDRQRGAARHTQAQRADVGVAGAGMVQQGDVHRRDALEDGDPVALDHLQRLARVEAGQQRQAGPGADGGVEPAGLAEGVEQRQAAHDDVAGLQAQQGGRRHRRVAGQVGVGQLGPLGPAACQAKTTLAPLSAR